MRNTHSNTAQFVTASDRLVRLVVEEALSLLPTTRVTVQTPCGTYDGVALPDESEMCAVSILRAADCMTGVMRTIMPSISVGKILIQRDETTALPIVIYAKLPQNIANKYILLHDPMLATGGSVIKAMDILVKAGVKEDRVIFINLVCCAEGVAALHLAYPNVQVITSAIDPILDERKYIVPGLGDFGDRYFGT